MLAENPCIIFVSRNNLALTKTAVRSALAQDIPCPVILLDNASSDGTMAWANTKPITTIAYPEQKSLAACWNVGLRAAWKAGYTSALLCNNDIVLRTDALSMLLSHGGEFVTCVSVDSEDQLGTAGDRNIEDIRRSQRPHPDHSCFLLRKSVTDKVGWFNEEYFPAYGEDAEWHVRCHRAGVRAVCIDIPFLHHGASTLKQSDPGEAARIRRGADANRQRFKKVYGCLPGSSEYYALFGSTEPAPHAM